MVFLTIFYKYIIQQYFTVTAPHSVLAGDNTKFTDFNTHCCPKILLRGWQKASHFTLVFSWLRFFFLNPKSFDNGQSELIENCVCKLSRFAR